MGSGWNLADKTNAIGTQRFLTMELWSLYVEINEIQVFTLSLARWSRQTNAMGMLRFLTTELWSRVDNVLSSCWNVRWRRASPADGAYTVDITTHSINKITFSFIIRRYHHTSAVIITALISSLSVNNSPRAVIDAQAWYKHLYENIYHCYACACADISPGNFHRC